MSETAEPLVLYAVENRVASITLTLSENFREAARAFVEKRPAGTFEGR
jgi:hypothetical protein